MYRPHTTLRRRATTAPAAAAFAALIALSACGDDAARANESSTTTQAPVATAAAATTQPEPETTTSPSTQPADSAPPATDGEEERSATVRERREAMAEAALLRPEDLGDGWQDLGPDSTFPMTAELAGTVPSCAPFADVVFEGNAGAWAHAAFGREADIAFASVTVFATEDEAAAMVAAIDTPEFDQCWADFNEASALELPYGLESASYDSVEPPEVELGGDSSSLHALEGTVSFGDTVLPDTCVCAFVQQGRTVVTFHAAAHVFDPASRAAVIATALARVDDEDE